MQNPLIEQLVTNMGISELFPIQKKAINDGLFNDINLIISSPTASGKTLLAILALIHVHNNEKECFSAYLTPLKALTRQKYAEIRKWVDQYEILTKRKVEIFEISGDRKGANELDDITFLEQLERFKHVILISTFEKFDSLFRKSENKAVFKKFRLIIIDEFHYIGTASRGSSLEALLIKIKTFLPECRLICLSCNFPNISNVSKWLNSKLISSDLRSVPLIEFLVYPDLNRRIKFITRNKKTFSDENELELHKQSFYHDKIKDRVIISIINYFSNKKNRQCLIFCQSKRDAEDCAKILNRELGSLLTDKRLSKENTKYVQEIEKKIGKYNLFRFFKSGIAWHHAGLTHEIRKCIEDMFEKGLLRVLTCTPTLISGINLPVSDVVFRDMTRREAYPSLDREFVSKRSKRVYIPFIEYVQASGRAGRPQYDDYGCSYIIAETEDHAKKLSDKYLCGNATPIRSQFINPYGLLNHILSMISDKIIRSVDQLQKVLKDSFAGYQGLNFDIMEIINFLSEYRFIEKKSNELCPTKLGKLTNRLYVNPLSINVFLNYIFGQDYLQMLKNHSNFFIETPPFLNKPLNFFVSETISENKILEVILDTPDAFFSAGWVRYDKRLSFEVFKLWIRGTSLQALSSIRTDKTGRPSIGYGEIFRAINTNKWLTYALLELAKFIKKSKGLERAEEITFQTEKILKALIYGVPPDLVKFRKLGLSRNQVMTLKSIGYDDPFILLQEMEESSVWRQIITSKLRISKKELTAILEKAKDQK